MAGGGATAVECAGFRLSPLRSHLRVSPFACEPQVVIARLLAANGMSRAVSIRKRGVGGNLRVGVMNHGKVPQILGERHWEGG